MCEYKAQQATERGFRFLKDPLFFTSSVFRKSTKRIEALGMIMAQCGLEDFSSLNKGLKPLAYLSYFYKLLL